MTNWKKNARRLAPLALVGSVACAAAPESDGGSEAALGSVSQSIIFGDDAAKGKHPWIAMLSYDPDGDGEYFQDCGGALVAPNWVLTAQHCVYENSQFDEEHRLPWESIRVTLGEHDRATNEGSEQVRGVKRIIYREPYDNRFDPNNPAEPNDVALIELDAPVQIDQYTKVVKFASGGDGPTPFGQPAQFAGWGFTEESWPDILQSADMVVHPNSVCNALNVNFNLPSLVDAKEMCVGGSDGDGPLEDTPGTCNKDSGGPLTVVRENGCPELIGTLSWGPACGAHNVFSRVSAHVDWLRQYVGVYEAEDMNHVTGGPHPEGWNIWDNSYISFTNTFEGGPQEMVVTAAGGYGDGWPVMRVTVDGQEKLLTTVDSAEWKDYPFTFDAPAGNAEVRIYLTNDVYFERDGQTIDRNLFLDKVRVVENGRSSCTAPAGNFAAELEVYDQWSTGYCARVKVTNNHTASTSDWLVVVDSGNSNVNQRWNTDFISGTGQHDVGPIGWNNAIQPGATNSDTGFCATRPAGSNTLPTIVSATATY